MTRLPALKAREVINGMQRIGFMKVRQKGSHAIFHHSDCRRAPIPIHPATTISPYLLSDILQQLQIDEDNFLRAIGRGKNKKAKLMFFAGIDIGSTMTKVAIMNEGLVASVIGSTGPEHRRLAHKVMESALAQAHIPFEEITYVIATGYGRVNVPFADRQVTEISCHAKGVSSLFPSARTVIDIGGQDCKAIRLLPNRRVKEFVMNDKCAAGTGRFLEVVAEKLGFKLEELGELSLQALAPVKISSTCTVFAEQEIISHLAEGASPGAIVAGIHQAIAERIGNMVDKIGIDRDVVLTGGGAKNIGLVKALETRLGCPVQVPSEPLLTGCIGAALLGKEYVLQAQQRSQKLPTKERKLEVGITLYKS